MEEDLLEDLEGDYRLRTENEELNIHINWQEEINQIDIQFIIERIEIEGIEAFEENYLIEYFNIDQILNLMFEDENSIEEIFPADQLWDMRDDVKITRLIQYIENENYLCPPIIGYFSYLNIEDFGIRDGNHRIALSRFLQIQEIPFIVHKNHVERIRNAL